MSIEIRCTTCLRTERWAVDPSGSRTVEVHTEGGLRHPDGHPQLAAWRALQSARAGGKRVVGVCEGCLQPLLSPDTSIPEAPFELQLPNGAVTVAVDGTITGPDGDTSEDALEAAMKAAYGESLPSRLANGLFRVSLMPVFIVILLAWGIALSYLLYFFSSLYRMGQLAG